MAVAAVIRAGHNGKKFNARTPTYEAERHQWRVFFDQVGTTQMIDGHATTSVEIDGDITVIVNDVTRRTCVQYAFATGPCT
jgi:hypothetical protein